MPHKCIICKTSSKPLDFIQHPQSHGAGSYWCYRCRTKEYLEGDFIVAIIYPHGNETWHMYWRLGYPVYPGHTLDDQLADIRKVGKWAHTLGKNVCGFHDWQFKKFSAGGFSFGHENSMQFLEENLAWAKKYVLNLLEERGQLAKEERLRAGQTTLLEFSGVS